MHLFASISAFVIEVGYIFLIGYDWNPSERCGSHPLSVSTILFFSSKYIYTLISIRCTSFYPLHYQTMYTTTLKYHCQNSMHFFKHHYRNNILQKLFITTRHHSYSLLSSQKLHQHMYFLSKLSLYMKIMTCGLV